MGVTNAKEPASSESRTLDMTGMEEERVPMCAGHNTPIKQTNLATDYMPDGKAVRTRVCNPESIPDVTIPVQKKARSSSWRKKIKSRKLSTLEKALLLIVCSLTGLCIILIVVVAFKKEEIRKSKIQDTCMTPECINIASSMISRMDMTAEPCEDFYQYACGRWLTDNIVPDDTMAYDIFYVLTTKNMKHVKKLVEEDEDVSENAATRKVKRFYKSCNNISLIEEVGEQPLLDMLTWDRLGEWPVISPTWDIYRFDMEKTMALLAHYRILTLVYIDVVADPKNNTQYIIEVDQSLVTLRRDMYLNDTNEEFAGYMDAYVKFMVDVAMLLGAEDRQAATKDVEALLEFEKTVANMTQPFIDLRGKEEERYNKMTIVELKELVPQIAWLRLFQMIMAPKVNITESEVLIVKAPTFIKELGQLIINTPKRVVANYILWRFVENTIFRLDQRFQDLHYQFYDILYKTDSKSRPRWRECVNHVVNMMDMAVSSMYLDGHFHEDAKEHVGQMINSTLKAFIHFLYDLEWADEDTKKASEEKAHAMEQLIAYPDYILDPDALVKMYTGLEMNEDNFFENSLNMEKFRTRQLYEQLKEPVDKSRWYLPIIQPNAYYFGVWNQIVFLAGILQPPFYNLHAPMYINYGGIGIVIGHEITHGFDDSGRKYDKHGNLTQWWPDEDIEMFQSKAQCVVEQYSNYYVENVGFINGNFTLGENIADNGGLKQAFWAYERWVEQNEEELKLPGLELNPYQLFFLNYAQLFCELKSKEGFDEMLKTDSHSPGEYRVKGTVSNSLDFATAFQCPKDSTMNPSTKCEVW